MAKKKMLKPQDVMILLKVVTYEDKPFVMKDLAASLQLSPGEITFGLERCKNSGLIDANKQNVQKLSLFEFLVHGLKYVFPVQQGKKARGIPTAYSASPVKDQIVTGKDDLVIWPYSKGNSRGYSIVPLYNTIPEVVLKDKKLYELLAIVECLRLGRRREVEIAIEELKKRLDV